METKKRTQLSIEEKRKRNIEYQKKYRNKPESKEKKRNYEREAYLKKRDQILLKAKLRILSPEQKIKKNLYNKKYSKRPEIKARLREKKRIRYLDQKFKKRSLELRKKYMTPERKKYYAEYLRKCRLKDKEALVFFSLINFSNNSLERT